MGLNANDKGGDFEIASEALHEGICYGIVDIGTQYSQRYNKAVHKVVFLFELPGERVQFEKEGVKLDIPMQINNFYTLSLGKKSLLRAHLEGWRGKAFTEQELENFDISKVIGAACQLQIIHQKEDDKTYANIKYIIKSINSGVSMENQRVYYSMQESQDVPENVPEWLVKKIKMSEEWRDIATDQNVHAGVDASNPAHENPDDNIPF